MGRWPAILLGAAAVLLAGAGAWWLQRPAPRVTEVAVRSLRPVPGANEPSARAARQRARAARVELARTARAPAGAELETLPEGAPAPAEDENLDRIASPPPSARVPAERAPDPPPALPDEDVESAPAD